MFNCKQIFIEYCSKVLGLTVNPKKHLFRYLPLKPGDPFVLDYVKYPSPKGWEKKTSVDVVQFWKGVDTDRIFRHGRRSKRNSASEREEILFVFVIVVELREASYLDAHNNPDPAYILQTRRTCRLDDPMPEDMFPYTIEYSSRLLDFF
jgi:hypothetical protein